MKIVSQNKTIYLSMLIFMFVSVGYYFTQTDHVHTEVTLQELVEEYEKSENDDLNAPMFSLLAFHFQIISHFDLENNYSALIRPLKSNSIQVYSFHIPNLPFNKGSPILHS